MIVSQDIFAYSQGDWFPAWPVLFLPFLTSLWVLYRLTKDKVDWKAAFSTVALFEAIVFPAEVFSVHRGHWVYNNARIWGPRLFGVPIEEPLLYYFFGPLIVITAMHAILMALDQLNPARRRGRQYFLSHAALGRQPGPGRRGTRRKHDRGAHR